MLYFNPFSVYLLSLLVLFLSFMERKKRRRSNFLFYLSFALFFGSIYFFLFLNFGSHINIYEKIKYIVFFFLILSIGSLTPFLVSKKKDSRILKIINCVKKIIRIRRYLKIKQQRSAKVILK